jgi:hypothetical protein
MSMFKFQEIHFLEKEQAGSKQNRDASLDTKESSTLETSTNSLYTT